jgi:ABC-2 type transport system ATP-binding protein
VARRVRTAALAAALALLAAVPAARADDTFISAPDGTQIHVDFFSAAGLKPGQRAPTVLKGPGFGGTAATDPNEPTSTAFGVIGVGPLRRAGYNVVTWDPPGFGDSGGLAELDSIETEAPVVSAIITWLAGQPGVQLDQPRDPRVGMAGGSYGGGIQLATAETDRRVDAITPAIAWNSLVTSLYKADTVKSSWSQLLSLAAAARGQRDDPIVAQAAAESQQGFHLTPDVVAYFRSRGPGRLVSRIRIPTLLLQGTVDTLFTLQESVVNHDLLAANRVPLKLLWFCGGHGVCLTDPGDTGRIQRSVLAWLDRYVRGDRKTKTGPAFEWVDQRGHSFASRRFPPAAAPPVTATGSGDLMLRADGGSGPYTGPVSGPFAPLGPLLGTTVGTQATNAVNVAVRASKTAQVLGAPRLAITYRGTAARADSRVLAQVVDDKTGKVLGNQVTPIAVVLDGREHSVSAQLEIVSGHLARGSSFTVQLVAQSSIYNAFPVEGSIHFDRIGVALPAVQVKS